MKRQCPHKIDIGAVYSFRWVVVTQNCSWEAVYFIYECIYLYICLISLSVYSLKCSVVHFSTLVYHSALYFPSPVLTLLFIIHLSILLFISDPRTTGQ